VLFCFNEFVASKSARALGACVSCASTVAANTRKDSEAHGTRPQLCSSRLRITNLPVFTFYVSPYGRRLRFHAMLRKQEAENSRSQQRPETLN